MAETDTVGSDVAAWGIHAGKTGEADKLFLNHDVVALGWEEIKQDLSKLPPERAAFRKVVEEAYPGKSPGSVTVSYSQLFRFLHEVRKGDLVAFPCKKTRVVHIGRVTGDYKYDPDTEPGYPHTRAVQWLKEVPRANFSQGALFEIGSALSFFLIKTYVEEFRAALEGKSVTPPVKRDDTVKIVAEDIEGNARDFVLKTLSQELKGHPLADFVAHLLNTMGFRTRVAPEGPDGGIDIVAHKDELGFEPPIIKVQVKSTDGSIGDPAVSALYGKVAGRDEHGLIVTLGTFTNQAVNFAKSKSNLRLIDGEELVDLVLAHYEELDSQYKALLPLKRVYVPQPAADEE